MTDTQPPGPQRIRMGTGPHDGMVLEVYSSRDVVAALIITQAGAPGAWHYEVGTVEGTPHPPAEAVAAVLRTAASQLDGNPPG